MSWPRRWSGAGLSWLWGRVDPDTVKLACVSAAIVIVSGAIFLISGIPPKGTQIVRIGDRAFYIPKAWMNSVVVKVDNKTKLFGPQPGPVHGQKIQFRPRSDWKPYNSGELPFSIEIAAKSVTPLDTAQQKWMEFASSQGEDEYNFVRVQATNTSIVTRRPETETFILKGYKNEFGQPLIFEINNSGSNIRDEYYSEVVISIERNLELTYRFRVEGFPERSWRGLHDRVLDFTNYIGTPKQP
jgi:hypothetical protein